MRRYRSSAESWSCPVLPHRSLNLLSRTPTPTSGNADAKRRDDARIAPGSQELLGGTRGFAPTSRRFRWLATTGDDQAVVAVIQKSEPRVARPRQDPSGVVPDD